MLPKHFAGALVTAMSALVCAGCGSDHGSRWEPHIVPSAAPAEQPKSDGKPQPEPKLKREPGTRI